MVPRTEIEAVTGMGLAGDAAFGTSRRQVLLMDGETLTEFGLSPGATRENITTEGLRLQSLRPGSQLTVDGVVLEIAGDCTPCDLLERLRPGLSRELVGRRGLLARVVQGGTLRVGASIVHLAQPSAGEHRAQA